MNFKPVNFDSSKPVYIQIMELIKKLIINREISLGDKLPSVREIAGLLEVNANTMQRAYKELEREGVTLTKRGMGSFVTSDINVVNKLKENMANNIVDNFIRDMGDMGYSKDDMITFLRERG
ncbi:GntR family transcriptional regulator [Clostridium cylindrosporum]|uniref:Transcriptional regulator n=1 Tax=Clostridium cylindrosporum DSM 605 TaxID=1121307 RepID=A0A0J8D902_CLOCY|nr:GntR family transcriptional regulator [Clostridium cylindrosporum]KMT22357.1 transcriptional regulator [Clostridium cylindrosporum DSM 605]